MRVSSPSLRLSQVLLHVELAESRRFRRLDRPPAFCHPYPMTKAAQRLIETFETLPADDKRVVTIEILRRSAVEEHAPLDEAELILAADQVFLDLDCREE